MKRFALVSCIIVLMTTWQRFAAAEEPLPTIRWNTRLNESRTQALLTGKPLVVYFSREKRAEEIPFDQVIEIATCAHYERQLFPQREFQNYANQAVFARVSVWNIEPGGLEARILQDLDVTDFPTIVVLDVTKDQLKMRGKLTGLVKNEGFLKRFREAFEHHHGYPWKFEIVNPIPSADASGFGEWKDGDYVPPSPFDSTGRLINFAKQTNLIP